MKLAGGWLPAGFRLGCEGEKQFHIVSHRFKVGCGGGGAGTPEPQCISQPTVCLTFQLLPAPPPPSGRLPQTEQRRNDNVPRGRKRSTGEGGGVAGLHCGFFANHEPLIYGKPMPSHLPPPPNFHGMLRSPLWDPWAKGAVGQVWRYYGNFGRISGLGRNR